MIEAFIRFVLAYLVGNIVGGQIVGWLRGGVDLRQLGSGNIGATNALRTQGKAFGIAVLLIDVGKGALAVLAIPSLPLSLPLAAGTVLPLAWLQYLCGIGVVLGHCYPVTLGLKGGKGVATVGGVFAALMPAAFLWMLAAFVTALILSGYVSLATLTAAVVALIYVALADGRGLFSATGLFTLSMVALVLFKHRSNLHRLLQGRELRFDKIRLRRRWPRR